MKKILIATVCAVLIGAAGCKALNTELTGFVFGEQGLGFVDGDFMSSPRTATTFQMRQRTKTSIFNSLAKDTTQAMLIVVPASNQIPEQVVIEMAKKFPDLTINIGTNGLGSTVFSALK